MTVRQKQMGRVRSGTDDEIGGEILRLQKALGLGTKSPCLTCWEIVSQENDLRQACRSAGFRCVVCDVQYTPCVLLPVTCSNSPAASASDGIST